MNTRLNSAKSHRLKTFAFLLLILAFVAGTLSCTGQPGSVTRYSLTITSGEGGSVIKPGEGTYVLDAGRVVELLAVPTSGYRFVKWTGNVATIANVNAASTTITMSGNYSIRANFEQAESTFYTLTIDVAGSGSTTPAVGQHTYSAGSVVSLTATPGTGYRFVNWTGNVGTIANVNAASTTITMNGDYSIIANFAQTAVTYYTLTLAVNGNGSTSPAVGQHSYAAGTVVPIIATPAGGYYFVNWTGNVGTIGNVNAASTTITMSGNYSIAANFAVALPYTLTMAVEPAGSASTSPTIGPHTYTAGTSIPISVSPASGYYFSHWTATAGWFANPGSAATTFTMPGQNVTVTAHFTEGPPWPPDQYTLTMAATGNGSTSPALGPHKYGAGTIVLVSASPAAGYYFSHWTATASSFANPTAATTNFTMPAQNVTVTAHFVAAAVTYNLTMAVSPLGGGTTSPTGTSPYAAGTVINIQAVAASGYRFVNWTAPAGTFGSATAAATTFTMPAQNVTVTANFVRLYTLTMTVAPDGGGTATDLTNASPYAAGTVVNIRAVPAAGYQFTNWTAPAGTFGNQTATTTYFTMPAQNVTVTANFQAIQPTQYNLTISSTAGGSVTTPGEGTFMRNAGTVVDLVAAAAGGYRFVSWVGDVSTVGNVRAASTTITVNGNYRITALFTATFTISAGERHTAGLKSNGTVVAVGANDYGQCNVGNWTGIVQVVAGGYHTVGLRSDGTVVAVGYNMNGQCNVAGWTDIVQVAAGLYHTVGLKSSGTVVAVGYDYWGQCNVDNWTNIVQLAAGGYHTAGLNSSGAVVAVGYNYHGQCNVAGWTNIVQVAAGLYHTIGLRSNGTAIAVGDNYLGRCNVGSWTSLVQVTAGGYHTVGLRSGGTVVAVGDNYYMQCDVGSWTNIIQVAAGGYHTVGLRSDGMVVAVGANWWGQRDVGGWDLN